MSTTTFTAPPNHRPSESCATCAQWNHGHDVCRKFPNTVRWVGGYEEIYDNAWDGMVCDSWEPRPDQGGAQ